MTDVDKTTDNLNVFLTEPLVLINSVFDSHLKLLHDFVSRWIKELSSSDSVIGSPVKASTNALSLLKRTLLSDIPRYCLFFGHESVVELLLPQLLTLLNDQVIFESLSRLLNTFNACMLSMKGLGG